MSWVVRKWWWGGSRGKRIAVLSASLSAPILLRVCRNAHREIRLPKPKKYPASRQKEILDYLVDSCARPIVVDSAKSQAQGSVAALVPHMPQEYKANCQVRPWKRSCQRKWSRKGRSLKHHKGSSEAASRESGRVHKAHETTWGYLAEALQWFKRQW